MTSGPLNYTSHIILVIYLLLRTRRTSAFYQSDPSIWHCNSLLSPFWISESSSTVICRCQHMSACQPYHQSVLLLPASAATCSTISDHGCCSCSSSSNVSQPFLTTARLQQSACWPTNRLGVTSSQFYVRPLDLCSACLDMLECQQPYA